MTTVKKDPVKDALCRLTNQSVQVGRLEERTEILNLIETSISQAAVNKCSDLYSVGWISAMKHLREQITIGRKWL